MDCIWYVLSSAFKEHSNFLQQLRLIFQFSYLQSCNHISSSKQPVTKRKEAQKLAQTVLATIQSLYAEQKSSDKHINALENAFGTLEIKSN